MKVVLDTNVLIALAFGGGETMQRLAQAWQAGRFTILTCEELVEEFAAVLERPHLKGRFKGETRALVEDLLKAGEFVVLKEPYPNAPDERDRFLLALLRDGGGEALVTGDRVMLELEGFEDVPIMTARAFCDRLEASK